MPIKVPGITGGPCSDQNCCARFYRNHSKLHLPASLHWKQIVCQWGCNFMVKLLLVETAFFEADSSQLRQLICFIQKSQQQLRQEVVAFMRDNRVIQASEGTIRLESLICNKSLDVYGLRMAIDSEWADHVVVVAMARMIQIDIMIVTSSPSSGPENIMVWVVGKKAF